MLLHGLGATGDFFGALYDELRRDRRVLIVDLLGFGRSIDEQRTSFGLDDHVDHSVSSMRDFLRRSTSGRSIQ